MDSYLQRLHEAITSATRGMTMEELTRHPEGKWSAAEVLEHLYLTYTGTVKGFERCLQEGKPLASAPTMKQRFQIAVVTGAGYFPAGREAPKLSRPRGTPADKVIADIGPQITAMDEVILKCEARHGKRTRLLDHPVLGPLTAKQWRKFHWIHGWHHVKQILQRRRTG
ncbi:MAG: DUF1569 domain-containing protein [Acidobacteriia bacterium]|nr:DUF1569 domain-containing protein [Terriglobia bacterium]